MATADEMTHLGTSHVTADHLQGLECGCAVIEDWAEPSSITWGVVKTIHGIVGRLSRGLGAQRRAYASMWIG